MNNVGLEEVKAEGRQLDEKFNTIQSLPNTVMAKLSILVDRVGTRPHVANTLLMLRKENQTLVEVCFSLHGQGQKSL